MSVCPCGRSLRPPRSERCAGAALGGDSTGGGQRAGLGCGCSVRGSSMLLRGCGARWGLRGSLGAARGVCIGAVTPISSHFSSVGTFIPGGVLQFPPSQGISFSPLLPHFAATARISASCLCLLPFPCPSLSFCTASTNVALVMFLLSFAVCAHQHPILIPHSPHLVYHFLPDGCLNWSIWDMTFSISSTGKEITCFCTHKVFPYFSVYLNTQGHGPVCFFLYLPS